MGPTLKHPATRLIALALLLLGAAALFGYRHLSSEVAPAFSAEYFCDLSNGQLFTVPHGVFAPAATPSGAVLADGSPAGVKAFVYSCGSCAKERHIAYIAYLPESELNKAPAYRNYARGLVAPAPDPGQGAANPTWVSADGDEGQAIISRAGQGCSGNQPQECLALN
jgi:hypothetical protein